MVKIMWNDSFEMDCVSILSSKWLWQKEVIPFIAICTLLSKAQDKEKIHKSMKNSTSNSYRRKHEKCITKDKSYNVPWEHPTSQWIYLSMWGNLVGPNFLWPWWIRNARRRFFFWQSCHHMNLNVHTHFLG